MKIRVYIFLFCLLSITRGFGQSPKIDSILAILKTSKEDTSKVNALNALFSEYEFTDDKKATEYLNRSLELSKKIGYRKGLASAYVNAGFFNEDKGSFSEAMKNYVSSLNIRQAIDDKKGIADCYDYIGNSHYNMGNYSEALKNEFIALKIRETIKYKKGIAASHNNIGNVYIYLGNYPEALKNHLMSLRLEEERGDKLGITYSSWGIANIYYKQKNYSEAIKKYFSLLKLAKEIDDKTAIAGAYIGIGNVYNEQGNCPLALDNFEASLNVYKAIGNKNGISIVQNNIGTVYFKQSEQEKNQELIIKELDLALKNYISSLKIEEEIGNKAAVASSYNNIGTVYLQQKKYKESEEYLLKAEELSKEIGYKEYLTDSYLSLSKLDSIKRDFKEAFENHKLYILYRDSLDNEETRKKTIQNQMTYDFEKKEAVADAEHKKELENQQVLAEEKNRKQKIVLLFVSCFLILVLGFAGFVFRSLRVTRKQKIVIEEQKELVEEKQKEILDSIYYARRIQRSLLPTDKYLERNLRRLKK